MLTTVVGAAVGLTGFVVTVSVLVVQMATGTFSARYMRIWYRDGILKAVLAVLVGTFTFSYSLLRRVGGTRPHPAAAAGPELGRLPAPRDDGDPALRRPRDPGDAPAPGRARDAARDGAARVRAGRRRGAGAARGDDREQLGRHRRPRADPHRGHAGHRRPPADR